MRIKDFLSSDMGPKNYQKKLIIYSLECAALQENAIAFIFCEVSQIPEIKTYFVAREALFLQFDCNTVLDFIPAQKRLTC